MSRKSDIFEIGDMLALSKLTEWDAVEAAYDLGRAAQIDADAKRLAYGGVAPLHDVAKRLRARVRKLTGDTK